MDNLILLNNVNQNNEKHIDLFVSKFKNFVQNGKYIFGKEVFEFEKEMCDYIGMPYCIGLNSGTDALEIACSICDLKNDDEIIIQANAYIACAFGALKSNGRLRIIDCDKNGVFDINQLKKNITSHTKAVMVVHLYGDCCDMNELSKVCKNNNLILIEDCAQSFGSMYDSKKLGSFGDISCFSFYPSKNLGALGDAGAICIKNTDLFVKTRHIHNLGSVEKYIHIEKGRNSRMDTLQAMILLEKIKYVDENVLHKQQMAKKYTAVSNWHIQNKDVKVFHSYHLYVIMLDDQINRVDFQSYLKSKNIETLIHYKIPFYKSMAFQEYNGLEYKNCEKLAKTIVSIPLYDTITEDQIKYINNVMLEYIHNIMCNLSEKSF
jgi:dTDP-4-amino-4,6-dideoxygalactose transaminase